MFPSDKDPETLYKFCSMNLFFSPDTEVSERQTYSFLEWLGDIGGLFDALRYIFALIVYPFASYNL